MSGPKSGSWQLVPAGSGGGTYSFADVQQIMQRHLEKIEALQRRLTALGKAYMPAALNRSLDRAAILDTAWAERAIQELNHRYGVYTGLRDAVEQAEAEAAEAKAREETRRRLEAERARIAAEEARLAAERAARIQSTNALAAHLAGRRAERMAAEAAEQVRVRQQIGQQAIDVAAKLLPDVPEQVRREVEILAISCLAEEAPERALLIANDVKVRVDRANSSAKAEQKRLADQRRADAARAQTIHARLSELGAPARGKLNDGLYAVMDGERPYDADLDAMANSALKSAEQEKATLILKEALSELGYVVGEDFETSFAAGGGYFQKPEWGDYHCRLTLDAERERASMFMIRAEGETATVLDQSNDRDREMEVRWCDELPALLTRLGEKNLVVDLHRRMEPGSVPMPVLKRKLTGKSSQRSNSKEAVGQLERRIDKT